MRNWGDLPSELLSSVMAYLQIKDNILASLACKSWYEAAISVRIIEQPPWLLHFSKTSNSYEFYNPLNGNKQTLEFPESLTSSIFHYSTDGWLLMSKPNFSDFVLFNPFTSEIVVLPPLILLDSDYLLVAFSSAPTSNSCVVFIFKNNNPLHSTIRTWSPGETAWTSVNVRSHFLDASQNKVIFSNGIFYCLNIRTRVAIFDSSLGELEVLDVPPLPNPSDHMDCLISIKRKFVVDYKGHIYVICTCEHSEHMMFELNLEKGIWEEKKKLGSLTVFASMSSCESRSYVAEQMKRTSIYFPKLCSDETCTMTYSFHERRYSPSEERFDWGDEYLYHNIWITPPENVSELII